MNQIVATLYRQESRRVLSTLVRLLGSFDAAEEALHDAFIAAAEQWPSQGVPANPVAWLVSAGRFKAIDRIRRDRRFVGWEEAAEQVEAVADGAPGWEQLIDERHAIEDDRLRLSSPAATRAWPKKRASRSRCAKCAASRPRPLPAPS